MDIPEEKATKVLCDEAVDSCKHMQEEARSIASKIQREEHKEALLELSSFLRNVPVRLGNIRKLESMINMRDDASDKALYTVEVIAEEIGESIRISDWIALSDLLEFDYVQAMERYITRLKEIEREYI